MRIRTAGLGLARFAAVITMAMMTAPIRDLASAGEVMGGAPMASFDDSELVPVVPVRSQPPPAAATPDMTPPPAATPKPFDFSDEAVGAERARKVSTAHPLPAPDDPDDLVDKAPLPFKPFAAVAQGINDLSDNLGLDLKPWQKMSVKELSRAYSKSPVVRRTMRTMSAGTAIARNSKRRIVGGKLSSKSLGRCYMYVAIGLAAGGLTRSANLNQISGPYAKNAGVALKRSGFVNLLDMPQFRSQIIGPSGQLNLPVGAVLVYGTTRGSRNPAGHIEMKTTSGYVSDYEKDINRTANRVQADGRRLIGVYIRPDLVQ